jgi:DNA-binding transcriptional regulator LsrR (DeoR family)
LFAAAVSLFRAGQTVREVATSLGISKSEAGRLRKQAKDEGLLLERGSIQ